MTYQDELKLFLEKHAIERRDFLRWAGAIGAASGGLGALFGGALATADAAGSTFTPLRPPSTPLIVRGPYVSTWLPGDNSAGTWPTFWNHNTKAIAGIVRIDGTPYIFLGAPSGIGTVGTMNQTNLKTTATQSIYTLQAGGITLTLTFLSPVEPTDMQRQSIPLSYILAQVQSNDGKTHSVSLYFDISAEWSSSDTTQQVTWSRTQVAHNGGSLTSQSFALVTPHILSEHNNYPQWGYPVWATANVAGLTTQIGQDSVVRNNAAHNGTLDGSIDGGAPRAISDRWPVLGFNFALGNVGTQATTPVELVLGHVRNPAVSYLGQNLHPLWLNYWSNSDQMLAFFYDDVAGAQQRANQLNTRINNDATSVGGANYAALCALAARQAFGGMELVNSPSNTPWLVLKELSTGGGFSTVDVVYPAYPILLYLNPELVRYFIDPLLTYTESGHWPHAFCVHDLGGYPNAGGHNNGGGENMPVEESANMLIMAATYVRYGNTSAVGAYAQQHYHILHQWADYLNAPNGGNPSRPNALDPLLQNQTDDFTGLIAHSTNLALKGIIGIGAMGIIAHAAGNTGDAQFYHDTAVNLINQWASLGQDPASLHLDIAYTESDTASNTGKGTYSLKYNAFPDRSLGLNLIPLKVRQEEVAYYKTKENTYGIPLDSRHEWIKTDWALWMAAGIGDNTLQQYFINAIYKYVNTTPDRAPFTDLYETNTGRQSGGAFIARPVIGGIFTLLDLSTRSTGFCCKKKAGLLKWKEKNKRGPIMTEQHPFKWRHFQSDIILLCVRWYLRYALSYRDLEEMMQERGLSVDHTTIYRWVQRYAPELEKRCRPHLKAYTDSWRVDETYIKIKKVWVYLYRAVDSEGNTLEFLLIPARDAEAAKRFFLKALHFRTGSAPHAHPVEEQVTQPSTATNLTMSAPRVINVDKNAAYPKAIADLKASRMLPESVELRQVKYLNNLIEQDHRFIKRLTKPGMGFFSFETAWRTLQGFEIMNIIRKGQLQGVDKGDVRGQVALVAKLFGVAV